MPRSADRFPPIPEHLRQREALFPVPEVARRHGVTRVYIDKLIASGRLKSERHGRLLFVTRNSLLAYEERLKRDLRARIKEMQQRLKLLESRPLPKLNSSEMREGGALKPVTPGKPGPEPKTVLRAFLFDASAVEKLKREQQDGDRKLRKR